MSASPRTEKLNATHHGAFNFLSANTQSSLFRNGEVLTRRDKDGSDAGTSGVDIASHNMNVANARGLSGAARKTCETNGFEILDAPLANAALDFFDHNQVVQHYHRECEELVAGSTGAQAFAFDHNIRSATGKNSQQRITGGQTVQGPAKMVHGDYTLTSAPTRLQDLAKAPGSNDTLASVLPEGSALLTPELVAAALSDNGRFAIINVWRSIADEPVQIDPLAMCDGQTVQPEDLVTFEIHYADRIGENYFSKFSSEQKFYFYPEMTRNEPMLLKQWDSAGGLVQSNGTRPDAAFPGEPCTFSFHSAFDDLTASPNAPDRWSIEVRCIVIYE